MAETSSASTIGEHLRRARQAKGLALEAIAERTKIHLRVLEALEEDRAHEHLSPVYVKSFLKTYAALLGEDFTALAGQYHLASTRSAAPAAPRTATPKTLPKLTTAQWAGLGAVLAVVLLFGLWRAMPHADAGKGTAPAPTVVAAPKPAEPAPAAKPAKPLLKKHEPLELIMHVRERCWVQVKADREIVFQQVLNKGARERWTAAKEFELWLGNAGAVRLELSGHDLGSPGKSGEVVRGVKLTREGLIR